MATTRSFTGYLTSDLVGTENVEAGDVFTLASLAGSELNIVFQDGEGRADGDGVNNESPLLPSVRPEARARLDRQSQQRVLHLHGRRLPAHPRWRCRRPRQ